MATQAAADSGGTTQTVSTGEYIYTFATKAPSVSMPPPRTGLGSTVPEISRNSIWARTTPIPPTISCRPAARLLPRDIVRTADCNQCHGLPNGMTSSTGSAGLAAHGGSRRDVQLCIICHQPQTSDPDTGNSLDMRVFIHKIHMGSSLPSVQSGTPYRIIGFQNSVTDWSTVVYPADVRRCQTCHNPKNGAAQTNVWLTKPTAAACGSCHDDVNFATGANHPGGPQVGDNQCSNCHIPQGELEFDASILGAHTIPDQSAMIPGLNFTLVKVVNGGAGQKPSVTFTVRDNSGNGIPMSAFTTGSGSLSLTMAGPTSDYGYTSFGSDVTTPGYVTESVVEFRVLQQRWHLHVHVHACGSGQRDGNVCDRDRGPPDGYVAAWHRHADDGQLRRKKPGHLFFGGRLDGSAAPRGGRALELQQLPCLLEVHGSLRNNTEYCVFCHNPSDTDASTRAVATNPADKAAPPQGINFAMMVHKIHTGLNLKDQFSQDYVIVGFGGSHNSFGVAFASVPASIPNTGVRYPAMGPTGAVQDTAQCYVCHTNGSEAVLPIGKNAVIDPQGLLNPAPTTTSACTACHLNQSAFAHAAVNTDPKFGESCDVCHGTGAAFGATQVHAGK